jgi:molecular chaperone GrpE
MHDEDDVIIEADGSEEPGRSEEELEAQESRAGGKADKLKAELAACKKERQEYLDGWQRAKADYVNALKRFDEEKQTTLSVGRISTAEAFLPALDSLARAREAGGIPEGWQGIEKQLEDAARSLGLERFGEASQKFDPNFHEALGQDPASTAEEDDTITAVLERGWKAGNRVIRPARVRVAHFEG